MNKPQPNLAVRMGLSVLGTGYIPKGGGTVASLAALVPAYFLAPYPAIAVPVVIAVFFLGVWGSYYARKHGWVHDDRRITIDEVAGMLLATIWLPYSTTIWQNLLLLGLAFLFFRGLDIFKPFPIKLAEKLPAGWGVMLDDLLAGLIANGLVQLMRFLPSGWLDV